MLRIGRTVLAIALVASMGVVPARATTVGGTCVAQTTLTSAGTDTFTLKVCGTSGIGSNFARNGSMALSWTVTTNLTTRTCSWPANGIRTCNGVGRIPATVNTTATISISAGTGLGPATANWEAVL